ncbi:hypothetical protein C2W62_35940 [Candidatus Entotheonella serta]|nr:hypothetical protein C2W62_35940 [Candidatus Entotheonella serta]
MHIAVVILIKKTFGNRKSARFVTSSKLWRYRVKEIGIARVVEVNQQEILDVRMGYNFPQRISQELLPEVYPTY